MGRTNEIWDVQDGQVSFGLRGGAPRIPNLKATVALMHEDGMAADWLRDYDWEGYSHMDAPDDEIRRLEAPFGAYFATKTMGWLDKEALERRILLAPCNDAREIALHEQLRARDCFAPSSTRISAWRSSTRTSLRRWRVRRSQSVGAHPLLVSMTKGWMPRSRRSSPPRPGRRGHRARDAASSRA